MGGRRKNGVVRVVVVSGNVWVGRREKKKMEEKMGVDRVWVLGVECVERDGKQRISKKNEEKKSVGRLMCESCSVSPIS